MKIIVCLDDKYGMLFNKRRQSADRVLVEKIVEMTRGCALWIHPFSQKIFDGTSAQILVDEKFLERAGQGEYCFVEAQDVMPYSESIEEIIVFGWNRVYPADFRFPAQLLESFRKSGETLTFPGNSHDEISMEVYAK